MVIKVLKQAHCVKTEAGGKSRKVVKTVITVITVTTQWECDFQ